MILKHHEIKRKQGAYVVVSVSRNGLAAQSKIEEIGSAYALRIQAEAAAAKLDGRDPVNGVPEGAFDLLLQETRSRVKLTDAIASACRAVLVHGDTWKVAAAENGVTEPGILKGLRAMKVR